MIGSCCARPLCELLRIDAPILCAPFGPWDQVELAVAVCEAGALGALGTAVRSVPVARGPVAAAA
jgi:nitronate monooxygenase/enoyl-[acyl-carrier protein] reductase II